MQNRVIRKYVSTFSGVRSAFAQIIYALRAAALRKPFRSVKLMKSKFTSEQNRWARSWRFKARRPFIGRRPEKISTPIVRGLCIKTLFPRRGICPRKALTAAQPHLQRRAVKARDFPTSSSQSLQDDREGDRRRGRGGSKAARAHDHALGPGV